MTTSGDSARRPINSHDDEPTLVSWLHLAGTRGMNEVAAAIRVPDKLIERSSRPVCQPANMAMPIAELANG